MHRDRSAAKNRRTRTRRSEQALLHHHGPGVGGIPKQEGIGQAGLDQRRGRTTEIPEHAEVVAIKERGGGTAIQGESAEKGVRVVPLHPKRSGASIEGNTTDGGAGYRGAEDSIAREHHGILEERICHRHIVSAAIERHSRTGHIRRKGERPAQGKLGSSGEDAVVDNNATAQTGIRVIEIQTTEAVLGKRSHAGERAADGHNRPRIVQANGAVHRDGAGGV